jgi:16S rRNA (uracil1498-N3)-methyltransferase
MSNQRHITHHVMFSDLQQAAAGDSIEISAQEAHHAVRVKRVNINDQVGVLDGQGRIASGNIRSIAGSKSKPTISIELNQIRLFGPITPRVEIFAALPKGDRLDRMIDQLSQLGVSAFTPLICNRSQRKPETIRPEKLERIAIEASKQCHRPWALEINDPVAFPDAIQDPDAILADASGNAIDPSITRSRYVILIGPEGGWSDSEKEMITATGLPIIRFGLFVLRIEAAACAASANVLSDAVCPPVCP